MIRTIISTLQTLVKKQIGQNHKFDIKVNLAGCSFWTNNTLDKFTCSKYIPYPL